MRLGFVDEVFYPFVGGGEIFLHEVGKRLVKKGHEVDVITCAVRGSPKEEEIDGINVKRICSIGKLDFISRIPYEIKRLGRDYDVLASTSPLSRFVCNRARGNSKFLGMVFAYWGDSWEEFEAPGIAQLKSWLERRSLTKPEFDMIISSNEAFRATAERLGIKADVKVVPSGVDTSRFMKGKSGEAGESAARLKKKYGLEGKKVILFVGRVIKIKGLEYAIRALEGTDYALLIVGDGPGLERLQNIARSLGVELVCAGKADPTPFYHACDLFTLPSIMEGCPLTILEAFAAGKPVVASNVAGIPEILRDGKDGLLIEPKDVNGLKEAFGRLLEDDNYHKTVSESARSRAKQYDWSVVSDKMSLALDSLCKA